MGPYCKFCGQRCFIHLTMDAPPAAVEAYGHVTIIATCAAGQAFEKERTGWCWDDIRAAIDASAAAGAEKGGA